MDYKSVYLGDGAYASFDKYGDLYITANDHDPEKATDTVFIEKPDIKELVRFLTGNTVESEKTVTDQRKDLRVRLPLQVEAAFNLAKEKMEKELGITLRDNEFAARLLVHAVKQQAK